MASMKDSGVEWIGDIPEEWKLGRLGFLASMESGATPSKDNLEYWDGTIPWISSMEVKRDVLLDTSLHISPAAIESCSSRMLPAGTVVMVVRSGILQHTIPVAILGASMAVNQDIKAFQFCNSLLPKYFFYFVKGNNDNLLKVLLKDKSTVDNISQVYLKMLRVPVPPKTEQQAIAALLDQKCAAIDATSNTLETQISTLERYRASVIHEAVTRGLDPTAPTKPSNVDWIGNIPQGWSLTKLQRHIYLRARLGWKGLKADEYVTAGYPMFSAFNIVDNKLVQEECDYITEERYKESPEIMLAVGDVLLVKDGAGYGKHAYVHNLKRPSTVNGSIAVLTPDSAFEGRFLNYCLGSELFKHQSRLLLTGMGVPHLTQHFLKNVLLTLPPIAEQKAIADYLDARTAAIDTVIATKRKQLDVLKRRRQSLIYEYVTGKRRVNQEGEPYENQR